MLLLLQTKPPPNSRVATVAYGHVLFVKQQQVNNNFQTGPCFAPLSSRNAPSGRRGKPDCRYGRPYCFHSPLEL